MNKVILVGRLTRDPEIRYSQGANAMAIARFSIAVDRRFKREGEPDADFFNCSAFGKQAEFVERYLKQGTKMVGASRTIIIQIKMGRKFTACRSWWTSLNSPRARMHRRAAVMALLRSRLRDRPLGQRQTTVL